MIKKSQACTTMMLPKLNFTTSPCNPKSPKKSGKVKMRLLNYAITMTVPCIHVASYREKTAKLLFSQNFILKLFNILPPLHKSQFSPSHQMPICISKEKLVCNSSANLISGNYFKFQASGESCYCFCQ